MYGRWWALIAIMLAAAPPALAASCKTRGEVEAPIAFPRNEASDVQFARSMVPVILPEVTNALPPALTCSRSTVSTALGRYAIGGENGDAFPRVAMRADERPGPVAYLAAPGNPGTFALVVHRQRGLTVLKRFYAGIPSDQRLAEDIRAALASDEGLIAYEPEQKMVSYSFDPSGAVPPPVQSGGQADGSTINAGPQIFIPESGDPRLLDTTGDDMRHKPSGFACPQTFDGLAVMLMSIEPRADYLSCSYRAGTDLRYREDDPIRYQINLFKARPGDTPRGLFDELTGQARGALHIKGDHAPPLATGQPPAPELAVFWDTDGEGVQGVWAGKAGGWIVWLRAQYPPGPANDAEAGKVARILFARIGEQVK